MYVINANDVGGPIKVKRRIYEYIYYQIVL